MNGSETRQEETPRVGTRVLGAVFLVVGYWMVQNFPDIIFDEFGGQSLGPFIIFVAAAGFGLPILPILIGSRFLFFPQEGTFESDASTEKVVPYRIILTGMGIFVMFIVLVGGANQNWRSWPTADGEVLESSIEELSYCDTDCWELYVVIQFEWEGMNWNVSYDETFPSLAEAEVKENKINDMESVVVAFEPQSYEYNHFFPEIENGFYVDVYVVAFLSGILALGLGVRDARHSKKSESSLENE